jgi:hypothetical protein
MVAFFCLLFAVSGGSALRLAAPPADSMMMQTKLMQTNLFTTSCPILAGVKDCHAIEHGDSCMDFDLLAHAIEEFSFEEKFEQVCKSENAKELNAFGRDQIPKSDFKPMIFIHVHKGAGVLICHMARAHERVIHPEAVCSGPGDGVTLIGTGHNISCADRKVKFSKQGATFGMIEREVNEDDLCHDEFRYGIALRDPLELAESMTNFDQYCSDWGPPLPHDSWERHLDCLTQNPDSCKHLKSSITGLYHFYDNYLVRTLGGNEIFQKPPGSINEDDVQKVIKRLEKFDIVVPFNGPNDVPLLMDKLGWGSAHPGKKDVHSHPHSFQHISDEARPKIKARLWADYKVVQHFFPNMALL